MNTSWPVTWSRFGDSSGSAVLRTLPRLLPAAAAEGVVALALGALVGLRFGPVWGAVAAAAEAALILLARRSPPLAVSLLLFAYCLPRLETVQEAAFFLRAEDFVVAAICATALRRRVPAPTPLDGPIAVYAGVLGLTCVTGLALGTIASPLGSALTLLKHAEFLCGYFAAAWALRDDASRRTLYHGLLAGTVVLAIVATVFLAIEPGARTFNRHPYLGDSNHVGGFASLACCAFLARRQYLAAGIALLLLLSTGSRTAMLGLGAGLVTLAVAARSRGALALLAAGIVAAAALPQVRQRVLFVPNEWRIFRESERGVAEGFPPAFSYNRNRFECWMLLLDDYRRFPVTGTGPGSRDRVFYENQVLMTLGESGLAGLAAFLLLLWSAWRRHPGARPALAAMMVMALASNAFTISRMAGPFWLLTGGVTSPDRTS